MKASIAYHLSGMKKPLIIYYSTVLTLLVLSQISLNLFFGLSVNGTMINGIELASMIFIFVVGLNIFKESFLMLIQNGRTRKSVFLSFIYSILPVCGLMALIDSSLAVIGQHFHSYQSLFYQIYGARFTVCLQAFGASFLWSAAMYLSACITGYLITTSYYRMNKSAKLLVSIGIPVFLVVVLPILDASLTRGAIGRTILDMLLFVTGAKASFNPLYPIGFAALYSLAISACSFLLVQRAIIKD